MTRLCKRLREVPTLLQSGGYLLAVRSPAYTSSGYALRRACAVCTGKETERRTESRRHVPS